jgi:hypothetical protein
MPEDVWWLGFDTAHYGDLVPAMVRYSDIPRDEVYRDLAYITAETRRLAEQLTQRGVIAPE